jgi:hypothetical protein
MILYKCYNNLYEETNHTIYFQSIDLYIKLKCPHYYADFLNDIFLDLT